MVLRPWPIRVAMTASAEVMVAAGLAGAFAAGGLLFLIGFLDISAPARVNCADRRASVEAGAAGGGKPRLTNQPAKGGCAAHFPIRRTTACIATAPIPAARFATPTSASRPGFPAGAIASATI